MPDRQDRRRLSRDNKLVAALIAQTRKLVVVSSELLGRTAPDTFLGRRTHEPFSEDDGRAASSSDGAPN